MVGHPGCSWLGRLIPRPLDAPDPIELQAGRAGLSRAVTRCRPMASPGTSWHATTEPSCPNSEATPVGYAISRTASEAGGRAFESRPGHHLSQFEVQLPQNAAQLRKEVGGERPTNRRPRVEQTDERSSFACDRTACSRRRSRKRMASFVRPRIAHGSPPRLFEAQLSNSTAHTLRARRLQSCIQSTLKFAGRRVG